MARRRKARIVSSKKHFAKYGKKYVRGKSVKTFKSTKKISRRGLSRYTKGIVSKVPRASALKLKIEAARRTSKIRDINKPVAKSKPLFDFGKLLSPFSKVKGLVGGAVDKTPVTEKAGTFFANIFSTVKETGQTAYEGVTKPFVEVAEKKQKFDVIVKIVGIIAAVGTMFMLFKKR